MQDVDQDEFAETWETSYRDFIYLPDKGLWGRKAGVTNSDRLNSIQVGQPSKRTPTIKGNLHALPLHVVHRRNDLIMGPSYKFNGLN